MVDDHLQVEPRNETVSDAFQLHIEELTGGLSTYLGPLVPFSNGKRPETDRERTIMSAFSVGCLWLG